MDQRFSRHRRLRKREDISPVFRFGLRAGDDRLLVVARQRKPEETSVLGSSPSSLSSGMTSRGGVSVGKKHGSAVRRNRLKRLCREAFRLSREDLPAGFDYMIVPRVGCDASLEELRESLVRLAVRLAERIARRAEKGQGGQ